MNTIRIGMFGFGTVGSNIAKILFHHRKEIEKKFPHTNITVKYIAVRNKVSSIEKAKHAGIEISEDIFTENHNDIWNDPEINCIIEVIGGTGLAKDIIYKAIETKRNIITANKAVLAESGNEIFSLAKENNVKIGYEASVAGGIPIIKTLKNHFAIGSVTRIEGILNGTCNYMLSNLENNPLLSYADVLHDAQEKGFAESNPSADVDGWDTAAKISILSSICFSQKIPKTTDFPVEGIANITAKKIADAQKDKKKIRLIASATQQNTSIDIRVEPEEISQNSPFYSVNGADNMIIIHHEYLGQIVLKGAGAGGEATAMSIISDILEL